MDGIRFDVGQLPGLDERPGRATPPNQGAQAGSFGDALMGAIRSVDAVQVAADDQVAQVAAGGGNLHEMALSLEKADVSMRVMLKARNKLLDAYNEVMRMSI